MTNPYFCTQPTHGKKPCEFQKLEKKGKQENYICISTGFCRFRSDIIENAYQTKKIKLKEKVFELASPWE